MALPLILVLATNVEANLGAAMLYGTAVLGIASVFSTVSRGGFLQLLAIVLLLLVCTVARALRIPGPEGLRNAHHPCRRGRVLHAVPGELAPRLRSILRRARAVPPRRVRGDS